MYRIAQECAQTTGVFIAAADMNYADMESIFKSMGWKLLRANTWQHALLFPLARHATHFFYEHTPADPNWIEALEAAHSLPQPAAFILTSRLGDERLWADVLNRGGYDLLLEPLDPTEVIRVVSAARKYSLKRQKHALKPAMTLSALAR